MSKLVKCMVCGRELHDVGLGTHLKKHNLKINEYYDKYLKTDPLEGICKVCGKQTSFRDIYFGYSEYHLSCVAKDSNVQKKKKDNFLKLPIEEQTRKRENKLRKYKETSLEKYGKDNYSKTEEFKIKSESTCLERYGVTHWGKLLTGKTLIESYGIEKAKLILTALSISGKKHAERLKKRTLGKTNVEIYGLEKAEEIKLKQSKPQKKPWPSHGDYTREFYNKSFRQEILNDQENLCAICRTFLYPKRKHFHHINFIKSDDRRENIVCLCPSCHGKTKNRLTYENTMEFLINRNKIIIIESRERKVRNSIENKNKNLEIGKHKNE